MLRICSRALVGMVKPCHLVKPASVTLTAGRNLTQQKELPSLPVPPLQQTCEIYLNFLEPILEVDELKQTKELVEEFQKAGGVGESLQRSLEYIADNSENWLTEHWIRHLYLDSRKPMVLSSYGLLWPRMDFRDKPGQIRCAAELISAVLYEKTMIDNETLPVEYMRGKPMCMKQYEQVISSCRIPGLETDSVEFYSKSSNPPKHISVVHNCQFFVLDVYNGDGTPLRVDQLCVQLERICNSSKEINTEPLGILTTGCRDTWSKTYINLIQDETNKESVSAIQSSIITVCLDGATPPVSDEMYHNSAYLQILHGGSQWNSGNRWFDKGVQFIIGQEGTCGALFSHAHVDGSVSTAFCDRIVANMNMSQLMKYPMEPLPLPQKIHFNITPGISKDIEEAKQHMNMLAQDLDLSTTVFDHFGKILLKSYKLSPDAFVQMALQLTYYRIHQRCTPIMEPASLRMFRLGRLAAINSTSPASAAFAKAFDDPQKQNSEKVHLLEKAIKAHQWYSNMAISGQSIESHLQGLMGLAIVEEISMPDLFTDASFAKAFDYGISTSQIICKTGCVPCIAPDGPGIIDMMYSIANDHIDIAVSTFGASNTCKENNTAHLIRGIEDALLDMRTLLEQTSRAEATPDLK